MKSTLESTWDATARLREILVHSPSKCGIHKGYADDPHFDITAVATPWKAQQHEDEDDILDCDLAVATNGPPMSDTGVNELLFVGTGRELVLSNGPPTLKINVGADKWRLRDATCRWLVDGLSEQNFKGINAACIALKTFRDGPPPRHRREARWTMNAWEHLSWNGIKLKFVRGAFDTMGNA